MHLIHTAAAREIVVALNPRRDLALCGDLLDTDDPNLPDEEITRREDENDQRVDSLFDDLCRQLRRIAERDHITLYVGDDSEATRTPGGYLGSTLEEAVWQEAQDAAAFTRCYEPETVRS